MPLLKSKISEFQLTLDPVLNEPYKKAKYGVFTSSEWHFLMADGGIDKTGLNYIYRKVGEKMTGMSCKQDISTIATDHGLDYEREGLLAFGKKMIADGEMKTDAKVLVQMLLLDGERCGGTPDGIWINSEKEESFTVRTIEVKCPFSFDGYIRLFKCKNPADVKKMGTEGKKYYWQVLHQLSLCEALYGYLVAYQPFFKSGKINIITFNATDEAIRKDLKLINERKLQAITIFDNIYKELTT